MFDIGWSELLILGVVTLIFVGPKELPVFLRTIGKYVGMLKTQAAEFRAHFDAAMREAELDQLKKDVEAAGQDVANTIRDAESSVRSEMDVARREFDTASSMAATPVLNGSATAPAALPSASPAPEPPAPEPDAHDANGLPIHADTTKLAEPAPLPEREPTVRPGG